jgi:hypothetical protein
MPPDSSDSLLELRDLYPELSDEELACVDEVVGRYLALVLRIVNRGRPNVDALD